jgi:hypothetical protein
MNFGGNSLCQMWDDAALSAVACSIAARPERWMMKNLLFALSAVGCVLLASAPAAAAPHPRECLMSVGPDQVSFNALQDQIQDSFCQHIPDLGPTRIVLDAYDVELRDMTVEIRILRDVGQQDWREDLEANTIAFLPPKKYLSEKGTASFQHNFTKDGDFIALVKATSDDGTKEYVGEYFFSVGETYVQYAAIAAGMLLFSLIAFGLWRPAQIRRNNARAKAAASLRLR